MGAMQCALVQLIRFSDTSDRGTARESLTRSLFLQHFQSQMPYQFVEITWKTPLPGTFTVSAMPRDDPGANPEYH